MSEGPRSPGLSRQQRRRSDRAARSSQIRSLGHGGRCSQWRWSGI